MMALLITGLSFVADAGTCTKQGVTVTHPTTSDYAYCVQLAKLIK